MARRKRDRPLGGSSRAEILRTLMLGGARGGWGGFGRYPEGVLASPRDMVILHAKVKSPAELDADIAAFQHEVSERAARERTERKHRRPAVRPGGKRDV